MSKLQSGPRCSTLIGTAETVVHRDPLDRATVIQISGELDVSSVDRLEAALSEAVARRNERVMVDLCDCSAVDSAMISALIRARRGLDRDADGGPPMVLVANRPQVRRVLALTGIDRFVPMLGDRHAALDLLLRFA